MKKSLLHDLFIMELQDLYDAEQQILDTLPKMMEGAQSEEVRSGFKSHLLETEEQVERLKMIADDMSIDLDGMPCEGMQGIVSEGEGLLEMDLDEMIKDLALIGAAQKVEHYEMAGYGTASELAKQMQHDRAVELLEKSLSEEKDTDKKLSALAGDLYEQLPN